MLQVQRHFSKGSPEIIRLCQVSKDLYNRCNFLIRKAWFDNVSALKADSNAKWNQLPGLPELVNQTKDLNCFKQLHNTKTAKQTIRKCITDWSNFRASLKAFNQDPSKFEKRPKPPYYKREMMQIIYYNETIKGGQMNRPLERLEATNNIFSIPWDGRDYRQVVVTPKKFGFVIEVQFDSEDKPKQEEAKRKRTSKDRTCSIDIGLNNLCAITLGQLRRGKFSLLNRPILVNGRIMKSVNQFYNKRLSKQKESGMRRPSKRILRKHYFRIENYFHHVSKMVVGLCLEHGIPRIVIGRNAGWKQEMNLGRKTNQKFCMMPFYLLVEKIKYKAALAGIEVVLQEESYTSKSSFFDLDPLPVYEAGVESQEFSGQRKKRGLYIASAKQNLTKDRFAVNADVNGSLNIGRKNAINESRFDEIVDRSLAARPRIVNPLESQR